MSAYIVFIRRGIRDPEELAVYSAAARPTLAGQPITSITAYGPHEVLEGPPIHGVAMVKFPTVEEAKAWYNGEGYTKARQHRLRAAEYEVFLAEGND